MPSEVFSLFEEVDQSGYMQSYKHKTAWIMRLIRVIPWSEPEVQQSGPAFPFLWGYPYIWGYPYK